MKKRRSLLFAVLVSFTLLTVPAAGQSANTEKEAKAIENLLIAPCCWRQPVAVHESPASVEIRGQIRQMLANGRTRDQILQAYVDSYGDKILSSPPTRGFHLLSYLLPAFALLAGALLVAAFLRRHRPTEVPRAREGGEIPGKYAKLLKREVGE